MPLSHFHPLTARWFSDRLGKPTTAQLRGWDSIHSGAHTLIAAPTGSGKTLAAFLIELDLLLREAIEGRLTDGVRVIYVSPLKALSADIHKNLSEPRAQLAELAREAGHSINITAAVRTGDTPNIERTAMLRTPPHILVTTPESLYLLLTAERSREMLKSARTVIVDEIHAVLETRRGAHLSLSLERLDHIAGRKLQRIGLSATQQPIATVAEWLTGNSRESTVESRQSTGRCNIIDEGHKRELDLALELPGAPLSAVMSAEIWEEVYDRIAQLIAEHRTTIVFVNTRRMAERVARHLGDRLGETSVTAHHGSLSKEMRIDAESRLKNGQLKALVATASLELGIDIGWVDLVCQIGSPRRISTFLQRVGRSGHSVRGKPKGRLFPLSRDELVECAALIRSVERGELDKVVVSERGFDVLAQQIVAEAAAASEPWKLDDLFALVRRAYPYRDLTRPEFDNVVQMVSDGFVTPRGRRGALIHLDSVNGRVRGRRGARLLSLTSGGAIPENADYRVIAEPEGVFVGTLNEDFAIESSAGDVFQLGTTSWRMLRVERGAVRVENAHGEPPTIPFWLGEAPARSNELSSAVAALHRELDERLGEGDDKAGSIDWLANEYHLSRLAALQIVEYLAEAKRMLGVIPSQESLVAERFFDEAGGMQLVVHAPFGSRVNKAWGLALRKRFCRQFNFELQAAATDDAVLLSLGPQHSFELETMFRFLQPESARGILIQAMLDAPVFATRWRWNANISLAVPRFRNGKKVPPPIQRMQSDDLLAAAFPDAAACLENIPGDRDIPDHPLVQQVIDDCLHEAMDVDGFVAVLERIRSGEISVFGRDLPEPSPLAHEILNAKPYAFLDDAPLEERRAHAVYTRRALEPTSAADLGQLDPEAIARVREEVWPDAIHVDELHDALMISGFLRREEVQRGTDGKSWDPFFAELRADRRATEVGDLCVATERLAQVEAMLSKGADSHAATRDLLRGRMEIVGPTTANELATSAGIPREQVDIALAALESEGVVLRGRFSAGLPADATEWCDRRILARIHRYTLNRLRAEIEPVNVADFHRFLFAWQRVDSDENVSGLEGLASVIEQLDGYEVAGGAWESEVLSARCSEYDPQWLDMLSLTGRVAWGRLAGSEQGTGAKEQGTGNGGPRTAASRARPMRSTPISLFTRGKQELWMSLAAQRRDVELSTYAQLVFEVLAKRGASFFAELVSGSGILGTQVEMALAELAAAGLVTSDSFAGLRALLLPAARRKPIAGGARKHRTAAFGIESGGRWTLLKSQAAVPAQDAIAQYARILLQRYGVVFNRLIGREGISIPWRELLMVYRRLEARGEVRGGRFVAGVTGEQFALPEALGRLRAIRRSPKSGRLVSISAADPLNVLGMITPGDRVPALSANRILYEDGSPIALLEGGEVRELVEIPHERANKIEQALMRRPASQMLRQRLGLSTRRPPDPSRQRRSKRKSANRQPHPRG